MMDFLNPLGNLEADREADGNARGLAIGRVTDNKDPQGLARVRVRLPWQPESQQSYWARLAVPMALAGQGFVWIPEVDEEVLVGFEMGDLTHPCILGSLWNGKSKPPENNSDGKNDHRLIRTRANSELRFFDGNPPSVELSLADGKHLKMDDQGIVIEDGQGNRIEIKSGSGALEIKSNTQIKLESPSISIKADASLELKSSGSLTINGTIVNIN
ncbi:MAG: phage tail protein [Gammaproteobacteria bacterium]|nr:phage tail protein [Gammaproteobacteria bacterium]MBU1722999.1 phage tail protein [Gammaproteobacteria bacterium]MBU2003800.1 phage tail protein [Gammaproteobacteria bacterium]